jgi:DNA-binding transcriptional MerR regulator/methylmalonyl-CoA mutase cobalamin-binding subunit
MFDANQPRHPIRVVSQRTGLSSPVLRAWERRYGAVTPGRSEGGQRLYSDADIRRLQLLATAVDGGRSIGLIAELGVDELQELITADRERPGRRSGGVEPDAERIKTAFGMIEQMRNGEFEQHLMKSAVELRPDEVVEGFIVPLLEEVGRAWQSGHFGPSTEHVASVSIRRFLEWLSATTQATDDGPLAVTGTPAGQRHEFGALLAGVIAAYSGWQVRFLGPDLPADEIVAAARKLGASMVALSAVHPRLDPDGVEEVMAVRRGLPDSVLVVVGGAGAEPHRDAWASAGILSFDDLESYREALESELGPA